MNETVVLGTHMRGGTPTSTERGALSLKTELDVFKHIARHARLTDYTILIMKQPKEKHTTAEREHDQSNWEKAAEELGRPLKLVYDFNYVPREPTTLAWNKLHRYAFERLHAGCFVYVDLMLPHWDQEYRDQVMVSLGELAEQSITADYVIGDYTPVVPRNSKNSFREQQDVDFKIAIEERVKQMLSNRFPTLLAGWSLFDALKRPRSEFHAISRTLYDTLKGLTPVPYDYGLQMLVVAKAKGLRIRRIDIGMVPEFGGYSLHKMVWQLRRVDFQLAQIQEWLAEIQAKNGEEKAQATD